MNTIGDHCAGRQELHILFYIKQNQTHKWNLEVEEGPLEKEKGLEVGVDKEGEFEQSKIIAHIEMKCINLYKE